MIVIELLDHNNINWLQGCILHRFEHFIRAENLIYNEPSEFAYSEKKRKLKTKFEIRRRAVRSINVAQLNTYSSTRSIYSI